MKLIDNFLNFITMYRLVLYILTYFFVVAFILTLLGLLPFQPINLLFSTFFLIAVCWITNKILAKVFNAPTNLESVYITAFILSLIITPINSLSQLPFLMIVGILAISSKYIFAINRKHIFNPVAISLSLSSLIFKFGVSPALFSAGASWWIGNQYMFISVLIGGLLVVRKLRKFNMVFAFLLIYSMLTGPAVFKTILESAIFFFTFIMLTEPQTTPPKKWGQIIYGMLIGLITVYQTPEVALLIGNIFSYIISPKEKLILKLQQKNKLGPNIYDFIFKLNQPFKYQPGQYMEWTLGYPNPDLRGNRRYFTLASSPTEDNLRIGVRFSPNGSSFKNSLINMKQGDQIVASQLSGEFNMPKNISKKLVFLAGGIGITPFRSIIKYLLDTSQKRDIILLYSNKTASDIVYKDIFDLAFQKLGIKTIYINTDTKGFIDEKMIRRKVADFKDRIFYLSGPHSMVDIFEKVLKEMGVLEIKTDFFPGYA